MHRFAPSARTQGLRSGLIHHRLYRALREPEDVCVFMQHHVFCVWDFQCLLKALQRELTCIRVPWVPTADPEARRLINEIVLGEESDEDGEGGYLSHFELYRAAMIDAGADTGPIDRLIEMIEDGMAAEDALGELDLPPATESSVRLSLSLARGGPLHCLAAAFTLGREDLIPDLFTRLLDGLAAAEPARFARFRYYLRRHVELDGESHGPQSQRLLGRLCGDHPAWIRDADDAAASCLEARLAMWDEIHAAVLARSSQAIEC